jgi:hypothetical protein
VDLTIRGTKKNRRVGRRSWWGAGAVVSTYALASPSAGRCENQKYEK